MNVLTQTHLKEALHYDPLNGKFTWLSRPLHHFDDNQTTSNRWNGRFAGNEAGYTALQRDYKQIVIRLDRTLHVASRLAWLYMTGSWPENQIDHIDGDSTNNSWDNLRDVTQTVNLRNKRKYKNNTSGHTGVFYYNKIGKWRAQANVTESGKSIYTHIGDYNNLEEAVAARSAWVSLQSDYTDRHGT